MVAIRVRSRTMRAQVLASFGVALASLAGCQLFFGSDYVVVDTPDAPPSSTSDGAQCPASKPYLCAGSCVAPDPKACGPACTVCAAGANQIATCSDAGTCGVACADPLSMCSEQCVNLGNDPNNCGSCGRICGAPGCESKVCKPQAFNIAATAPTPLVVSNDNLYFNDSGAIQWFQVNSNPSSAARLWSSGLAIAAAGQFAIAGGAAFFFYTTSGTQYVGKCDLQGCGSEPVRIATATASGAIATNGTTLVWADNAGLHGINTLADAGTPGFLARSNVTAVAMNSSRFFFADNTGIFRCQSANGTTCTPTLVTAMSSDVARMKIASDGSSEWIYFVEIPTGAANRHIRRCSVDGCTSSDVLVEANSIFDYSVTSAGIYFSVTGSQDKPTGEIRFCAAKAPCMKDSDQVVLSKNQPRPGPVATDNSWVYWQNQGIVNDAGTSMSPTLLRVHR